MPYSDPEAQRKAKAESARRCRRRKKKHGTTGRRRTEGAEPADLLLPPGAQLRSHGDGLAVLERALRLVDGDETGHGLAKARTASLIVGTLLRNLDAADIEQRIETLERRHLRSVS